jgi:hypothetical protein
VVVRNTLGLETQQEAGFAVSPCGASVVGNISLNPSSPLACNGTALASVPLVSDTGAVYGWRVLGAGNNTVLDRDLMSAAEGGAAFVISTGAGARLLPPGT